MNKNMIKTLKIGIVLLIIIAIVIGIVVLKNKENDKKNEITINSLPDKEYTEEEAKEFYTKTLIKHLNTFQNDFHLKYIAETINEDGTKTVSNEEFSKKGDIVSIYNSDKNERIIIDDKYFYHIDEDNYVMYKLKNENNLNTNMDVLFYSLDSINNLFVKTGNEILNGEKIYFEEYKMEKDNTVLVRYYFDENDNIKYIKAYKEDEKIQTFFTIEMLENKTYDFMFDMSEKYRLVNE